jgi:hypothetical protein
MKWLILRTTTLCIALAIVTFAVSVGVRSYPEGSELEALGFSLCNGKPCYLGIVAGNTKFEQATHLFTKYGELVDENSKYPRIKLGNAESWISAKGDLDETYSDLVVSISTYFHPSGPSLGSIIQKYGAPCSIAIYPMQCNTYLSCSGWAYLSLQYQSMAVGVDLQRQARSIDRIDPGLRIKGIELVDSSKFRTQLGLCHFYRQDEISSSQTPWLGFTSIDRYTNFNKPNNQADTAK